MWKLLALLTLAAATSVRGQTIVELPGPGGTAQTQPIGPACSDDNLQVHHDGTFENGIAFEYMGEIPPYDGAFGEAFDLGPGVVECVSLWLTQDQSSYVGQPTDVYVWEGGVDSEPGDVLGVVMGVVFDEMPSWPEVGRFDIPVNLPVAGDCTVGGWGSWEGERNAYYWAVDKDGAAGSPWVHVALGIGFPEGWQNPSVIWGEVRSMGIGLHFTPDVPVAGAPTSWGRIKAKALDR